MLLPISHEESSVRELPWVSFGLIAACLAAFVAVNLTLARRIDATHQYFVDAVEYFEQHPELEPDPRLLSPGMVALLEPAADPGRASAPSLHAPSLHAPSSTALSQRELDRRTAVWLAATREDPLWALGLVPAQPRVTSYLTHAFLHAGWAHLLGNLLFLYLTAPFVEDRWGRWRFLAFYLLAAVVSGGVYAGRFGELYRPLVGASGAISAVMAAFMVEFAATRLSFFFAPLFPLPPYFRFRMPAWLVFPGWFATDLLMALLTDRAGGVGGGGVAYWAHVAGFVAGLCAAVTLKLLRRGNRRQRAAAASTEALVQAQAAAQRGDPELAFALVEAELRRGGESDEAGELLWTLGRRLGEPARAAGALEGVIRRALRGGREEVALARWRELAAACPDHAVEPGLSAMLLEALLRRGELRELAVRLRGTLERLDERVPPASALRLLRLARGQGVAGEQVARLASLLVRDAMLPAADRRELEEIVRAAPLGGRALEAGSGG